MREDALNIFRASLDAADPSACIRRNLALTGRTLRVGEVCYDLADFSRTIVVGAGKASVPMARAVEAILGDHLTGGVITTKYGHSGPLGRIEVNEAGHPLPDQKSVEGTERMIRWLEEADERTLVLCLLSGGGSALMASPAEGITLEEKQQTTQLLLECGARIDEINALRKHLSRVKGGRLCEMAYPARVVSLILSDVVGDRLDVIASGPTSPDSTTFACCLEVVRRYGLYHRMPENVIQYLESGATGLVEETPKQGDRAFDRCQNLIIGSNRIAVKAAREKALSLGYNTLILSSQIEGEAREVAKVHAALAKEIRCSGNPVPPPACLISGGEPTVTIHGRGKGGRNQEFVLSAAIEIEGIGDVVIFSAGTDGTDGPTDAAGAVADGDTIRRSTELGLSPSKCLEENDSYNLFEPLEDLVITGPTGTNVMDIQLVLVR